MNIKVSEEWLEDGKYNCPYCEKGFSKKGISTHIFRMHTEKGQKLKTGKPKGIPAWNKGLTKETDERVRIGSEKCSVTSKAKYDNEYKHPNSTEEYWSSERRIKFSKTMEKSLLKQWKNGREQKGGYTKYLEYKNIKVQGTYELRMCHILDKMVEENKIYSWEYTNDRYPYIRKNGDKSTYLLDFKVYTNKEEFYYIETKGFIRENDIEKWDAIRNLGFRLDVLFIEDIKKLELDVGL